MNIILRDQLAYMNQYFEVIGITGYDSKHFNEIETREKIKMYAVNMSRVIAPIRDLIALWKIFVLIRKIKPDIVHTHTPKAGLLGMLAARINRIDVRIHTVAGLPLMGAVGLKRKILNGIEKITLKNAHYVFPNSHGLKEFIMEHKFCSPAKLKVVGNGSSNGIDTTYFSLDCISNNQKKNIKKINGIDSNDFVFCYVGRLAVDKGINELMDAFVKILEKRTNIKLVLVGPFEQTNGVLTPTVQNNIINNPSVKHVGRHDDIRPYLAISDAFVLPTYREGFPNVLLQAGAMGLPCIATDINGCNEIIQDGINGVLIEPQKSEAIIYSMELLLKNKNILKKMASNARPLVKQKFERSEFLKALLKEYQKNLQ